MNDPVPVQRRPTEREADLMRQLAIATAVESIGCTAEVAADALDRLTAAGRLRFRGDALTVAITVGGHRLIEARRDWLAFTASMEG